MNRSRSVQREASSEPLRASRFALRERKGFTLIELIVVIAVIIVLAAISIPAFSTMFKGRNLRDGAGIVQRALMFGRLQAMTRNRPVMVRLVPFEKSETGKQMDAQGEDAGIKTTTNIRWRIEMVDSDGDGDYTTDEDGINGDFLPWTVFPTFTNPDPSKPPPLGVIHGADSSGVWHTHPLPAGEEDDKVVESFEFPDRIHPRVGKHANWSGDFGLFVFAANGSCRILKPDLTGAGTGSMDTSLFQTLDAQGRPTEWDFRIEDPATEESAYFDIVPTTGIVNLVFGPNP